MENPLTAWATAIYPGRDIRNVAAGLGFYDACGQRDGARTDQLIWCAAGMPIRRPIRSGAARSRRCRRSTSDAAVGLALEAGELQERIQQSNHYAKVAVGLGTRFVSISRIAPKNNDFASRLNFYVTDGSWWPSSTSLHGAVVGIDWPGGRDTQEVGGGPRAASAITVAIGNTMGETMGSLVARANAAPDEAAIVEALQLGVLKELDQPDGRAQLDVQLHASSFGSVAGSEAATEPFRIAPSGPPPAATPSTPTPGPGIFADTQSQGGGSVASPCCTQAQAGTARGTTDCHVGFGQGWDCGRTYHQRAPQRCSAAARNRRDTAGK